VGGVKTFIPHPQPLSQRARGVFLLIIDLLLGENNLYFIHYKAYKISLFGK
jgi:hypothetical protein